MSRRKKVAYPDPGLGSLQTVLSCPSGKKLEVVEAAFYNDGTHGYLWVLFIHHGSAYTAVDACNVTTASAIQYFRWDGLTLEAGQDLVVLVITTGTTHIPLYLGYVEVSPA